ncbi:SHOCT domain-containing protein [Halalkalicoccus ordinarius]|uniref:SHOCT domain-containing protein n=1 Tax=Halalkalicoccus ordinarius TaxID=3116651 RepID=UPI00300EB290
MGGTNDRAEWEWNFVPRLLAQSLLYPIRAGDPLRLLKSFLLGGVLIVPFVVFLYGVSRGELSEVWRAAAEQGSALTAFLVVILAFVLASAVGPLGYLLRVVQRTAVEDAALPTIANWRSVAVDGANVLAIYFFYLFFPLDVMRRFLGVFGEALPIIERTVPEFVLVFLVFLYLYPAAAGSFAERGRLRSALPQRLQSLLWSRTYAVGAVTAGLLGGLIYVISAGIELADTSLISLVIVGAGTFYLFVAQHYVIGRTWSVVGSEEPSVDSIDATAGDPMPRSGIATGDLRDHGVLSAEDAATIRGRFEAAARSPDPDAAEQLEALRTLHGRGMFTREEYEEKRREIAASAGRTDLGDDLGSERSTTSKDRTTDVEGTETGRGAGPVGGSGTAEEDASDRLERFAMLRQLYGQDVLTEREYGEKRRELGPDHGSEGVPGGSGSDLAERFETLRGLYDRGLLTEEEYAEKRHDLLEEL